MRRLVTNWLLCLAVVSQGSKPSSGAPEFRLAQVDEVAVRFASSGKKPILVCSTRRGTMRYHRESRCRVIVQYVMPLVSLATP